MEESPRLSRAIKEVEEKICKETGNKRKRENKTVKRRNMRFTRGSYNRGGMRRTSEASEASANERARGGTWRGVVRGRALHTRLLQSTWHTVFC